jgi:hypothetical protein
MLHQRLQSDDRAGIGTMKNSGTTTLGRGYWQYDIRCLRGAAKSGQRCSSQGCNIQTKAGGSLDAVLITYADHPGTVTGADVRPAHRRQQERALIYQARTKTPDDVGRFMM